MPRVAILHHWFVSRGGGERVAECLASLVPEADVFTLLHLHSLQTWAQERQKWHLSSSPIFFRFVMGYDGVIMG